MKKEAFRLLHEAENSWWYKGRSLVVGKILNKYRSNKNIEILDFGSGYGGMFPTISKFGAVSGFEPDHDAREESLKKGYTRTFKELEEVFLAKDKFDLICLFDVLEHIENDAEFLSSL